MRVKRFGCRCRLFYWFFASFYYWLENLLPSLRIKRHESMKHTHTHTRSTNMHIDHVFRTASRRNVCGAGKNILPAVDSILKAVKNQSKNRFRRQDNRFYSFFSETWIWIFFFFFKFTTRFVWISGLFHHSSLSLRVITSSATSRPLHWPVSCEREPGHKVFADWSLMNDFDYSYCFRCSQCLFVPAHTHACAHSGRVCRRASSFLFEADRNQQ